MNLLKLFTGLDIGLIPILPKSVLRCSQTVPQLQKISHRLWLSYVGAMLIILTASTASVYQFMFYRLNQDSNQSLKNLAIAASHSLMAIKANPAQINQQNVEIPDNDGDLDLPWQSLKDSTEGVEWFDVTGNRLAASGAKPPNLPLVKTKQTWQQTQNLQLFTFAVYESITPRTPLQLQGYVRVTRSVEQLYKQLNHLLAGLAVGNAIALLLVTITGRWLTRRSMQPIEQGICQLQQFTADASHELRSPLAAIKTALDVMQTHAERVHPADFKKLAAITSATCQMTRLVEDLLVLSRLEAAIPQLKLSLPLNDILEDLIESRYPQAQNQQITLNYQSAQDIFVQGDAVQLQCLFRNLIDNALQYTPQTGIVTVKLIPSNCFVDVVIEDTGIGIAKDHIEKIFDRFWRADQARSRENGAGLGLSIAQAIAKAHGGNISVTSQLGAGSRFRVRLPRII